MSGRRSSLVVIGFVISVSLMVAGAAVFFSSVHYRRLSFEALNGVCGEVLEQVPDAEKAVFAALKEYAKGETGGKAAEDVLSDRGYRAADFFPYLPEGFIAAGSFLTGVSIFLTAFLYRNRAESRRLRALTDYLEQVNTGRAVVLTAVGEDDFSKLQDEIYKTVTYLYQTKDAAVEARNAFAENLSNIAHQIKTPITAISLSVQMMRKNPDREWGNLEGTQNSDTEHWTRSGRLVLESTDRNETERKSMVESSLEQVEKQLLRLTHLEEALLVLARIDAGTLVLKKNEVDVFTLLVLAADNLQELFAGAGVAVDIPELGEMRIIADLDWTMEAVMNLMKNCMEHGGGSAVHCAYAQNALYTEILIWDEGKGFEKEDIPYLFDRFYRGKKTQEDGIGIGLALSREIVERQNGTIRAKNRPEGGACFEIHFYSH